MGDVEKRWYEEVAESKAPTELVDMEPAEQEELYKLCKDAYDKSYDRLLKSKLLHETILSRRFNYNMIFIYRESFGCQVASDGPAQGNIEGQSECWCPFVPE